VNAVAISLMLLLATLAGPPKEAAPSAGDLLAQGNQVMREGDAETAAGLYAKAATAAASGSPESQGSADPVAALAAFNQGCAQSTLGRAEEAEKLFEQADRTTVDPSLSAKARFNLGHSRFTRGMAAANKEPAEAIETLKSAAAAFRAALEADCTDRDSARALEITRRQIKRLGDAVEQQKQQQQQKQKQSQQSSDKLDDLAKRQQQLADESAKAQQQQTEDPEGSAKESQRLKEAQEGLNKETAQALDEIKPEEGDTDTKDAAEQVRQAVEQQKQAKEHLDQAKPGEASPRQADAADRLKKASEAMARAAEKQGEDQQEGQDQLKQDKPGKEQEQKAEGSPQPKQDPAVSQLLDKERRERAERERRRKQTAGGIEPVDKDW